MNQTAQDPWKRALATNHPYYDQEMSGIWEKRPNKNGEDNDQQLTNFRARITGQELHQLGNQTIRHLQIQTRQHDNTTTLTIPAKDYENMNWVMEHLGPDYVVSPGRGNKERAAHAILCLSTENGRIPTETVWAHTGWATHNQKRVYIHREGAIGHRGPVPNVRVQLPPGLDGYALEWEPDHETRLQHVDTLTRLPILLGNGLDLTIHANLFAYTICLCPIQDPDFTLILEGKSGSRKSSIAGVYLSAWGRIDDVTKPGVNWRSTIAALPKLLGRMHNSLTVLDDYKPEGDSGARMRETFHTIVRDLANKNPRWKSTRDGGLTMDESPRGGLLITAETLPRSSGGLMGRVVRLSLSTGETPLDSLTKAQTAAENGHLAKALATYISWLAKRLTFAQDLLETRRSDNTYQLEDATHSRTPRAISDLCTALEIYGLYLADVGYPQDQITPLITTLQNAIMGNVQRQVEAQEEAEDWLVWTQTLSDLLDQRTAYVEHVDGGEPPNCESWGWTLEPNAPPRRGKHLVGWYDPDKGIVYLRGTLAHEQVVQHLRRRGEHYHYDVRDVMRDAAENGMIVRSDTGRNTCRHNGQRAYALNPEALGRRHRRMAK